MNKNLLKLFALVLAINTVFSVQAMNRKNLMRAGVAVGICCMAYRAYNYFQKINAEQAKKYKEFDAAKQKEKIREEAYEKAAIENSKVKQIVAPKGLVAKIVNELNAKQKDSVIELAKVKQKLVTVKEEQISPERIERSLPRLNGSQRGVLSRAKNDMRLTYDEAKDLYSSLFTNYDVSTDVWKSL